MLADKPFQMQREFVWPLGSKKRLCGGFIGGLRAEAEKASQRLPGRDLWEGTGPDAALMHHGLKDVVDRKL